MSSSDVDGKATERRTARRVLSRLESGQLQREDTRGRLLRAAYSLFAQHGRDAVVINQITEAAAVGFGSFYNHFTSKEAIHAAVADAFVEDVESILEPPLASIADAAERLSVRVRYGVARAGRDTAWRGFLLRETISLTLQQRGLEYRLSQDICRGLEERRFRLPDATVGPLVVAAGLLGAVAGALPPLPRTGPASYIGQRAAESMLRALGLTAEDAAAIVSLPMPSLSRLPRMRAGYYTDRMLIFGLGR